METGDTLLAKTGVLDSVALRRLQAVAITTVDDLRYAVASTPEPIARLIGAHDLTSLEPLWARVETDRHRSYLAMAVETLPALGAEPPPDVEVFDQAPEDLFAASLNTLGPPPEEVAPAGDQPPRVDCIPCLRPVRDQGRDRGTCVGHAVAAVLECLILHRDGYAVDLSPQFLYWACKQRDGRPTAGGTLISIACDVAVAEGVCTEADWPYNPNPIPGNEGQGPPPDAVIAAAAGHKATAAVHLPRKSTQASDRFNRSRISTVIVAAITSSQRLPPSRATSLCRRGRGASRCHP